MASLAYLTAATHGLTEEAEELKEIITEGGKPLPDLIPDAKFLKPPPPVQQAESNWPLLTVSRGFFERAAVAKTGAAGQIATLAVDPTLDTGVEEDGWGDDDEEEAGGENKKAEPALEGEAGWDVEDADLEIPDLGPAQVQTASDDYVHLPTPGQSPSVTWTRNSQLAVDHVMAGSLESACRLLHDQVG